MPVPMPMPMASQIDADAKASSLAPQVYKPRSTLLSIALLAIALLPVALLSKSSWIESYVPCPWPHMVVSYKLKLNKLY